MALQDQEIPIEFGQGLDTKTDPKQVVPGKLLTLENGVFNVGKKITKRFGYDALGRSILGGGSLTSSQGLAIYQDEILQASNNHLYTWSSDQSVWIDRGQLTLLDTTVTPIMRPSEAVSFGISQQEFGVIGNLTLYVYLENITLVALIRDRVTGAVIVPETFLNLVGSGAATPRIVTIGNTFMIFYHSGSNMIVRLVDATNPTVIGPEIILFSNFRTTGPYFDAVSTGTQALLSYSCSTGGGSIEVAYVSTSGVVGTTTNFAQQAKFSLQTAYEPVNGRLIVVSTTDAVDLDYFVLNSNLTVYQTTYTIESSPTAVLVRPAPYVTSPTTWSLFYSTIPTTGLLTDTSTTHRDLSILGGGGTSTIILRSVGTASRAFLMNGVGYVFVIHDSVLQQTYFLIDATGVVYAKISPDVSGGLGSSPGGKTGNPTVYVNGSTATLPIQVATSIVISGVNHTTKEALSEASVDFDPEFKFIAKEINNTLLITGGQTQLYDGLTLAESGFTFFPEGVTVTPLGGGSLTGTYEWFAVYEWTDRTGNVHQSAPSIGVSVSLAGQDATVVVPTLRLTGKSNVAIVLYRTLANQTIAHRVGNPVANDKTVDYVTIIDSNSDSSIADNQVIYTTGGVLDNDAPPASSVIEVDKNRALLAGLEDNVTYQYSKQALPGSGVAFSSFFTTRVDPLGGAITAIKYLDDKTIIFKRSYVFYQTGQGPDDTGGNNDFSPTTLITSDVGCVDPKSIVLMPHGIMFKSAKGIYLLDRSLQASYIGSDVEKFNDTTIMDALLIEDKNQVRFLTIDGIAIVYDYFYGQWSTFTNHGGVGAGLWKGIYTYARSDGTVYQENNLINLDAGAFYPLNIGTSWLKVTGIQGFQRCRQVYLIGDYRSAHVLSVNVFYDYDESTSDPYTFNASPLIPYQFRIDLKRQKCESLRLEFQDVQSVPSGPGYDLTDMTLAIAVKKGPDKLPVSQQVGS